MASVQSKLFNVLLRLIHKKRLLKRQFKKGNFRVFTCPAPPPALRRSCHIDTFLISGRNVFTLRPKQDGGRKHILYLHGGAYVASFTKLHWYFMEDLAKTTGCAITTPDYPLAPEHTYRDVLEMMIILYRRLLLTVRPEDLILMGDSAGGGIALALAQKAKLENLPQPYQIILLSPWLDITLSNPVIAAIEPTDPFTGLEGLRMAGEAYAGGDDPKGHLLSPLNGPLEGLGKISVFAGSREILVADARRLRALMEEKGYPFHYREYEDMIHVWMLLHFPESKMARAEIVNLILSSPPGPGRQAHPSVSNASGMP